MALAVPAAEVRSRLRQLNSIKELLTSRPTRHTEASSVQKIQASPFNVEWHMASACVIRALNKTPQMTHTQQRQLRLKKFLQYCENSLQVTR